MNTQAQHTRTPQTYTGTYVRDDSWVVRVSGTLQVQAGDQVDYTGKGGQTIPMRALFVKQRVKANGQAPDYCLVYAERIAQAKGIENMTKAELAAALAKAQEAGFAG